MVREPSSQPFEVYPGVSEISLSVGRVIERFDQFQYINPDLANPYADLPPQHARTHQVVATGMVVMAIRGQSAGRPEVNEGRIKEIENNMDACDVKLTSAQVIGYGRIAMVVCANFGKEREGAAMAANLLHSAQSIWPEDFKDDDPESSEEA